MLSSSDHPSIKTSPPIISTPVLYFFLLLIHVKQGWVNWGYATTSENRAHGAHEEPKLALLGYKRFAKGEFWQKKGRWEGGIVQIVSIGAQAEEWLILRKMLKEYLSLNIINNFHLYTKLFKIVSIGCLHSQCVVDPLQECGSF